MLFLSLINSIIDRIRNEFNELGIKYFITRDYQLYYLLAIEDIVIFLVVNLNSSSDIINAYLYFLAEKVAQIFSSKDDNIVELLIPKFSIDVKNKTESANESHSITLNENENYRYKFIIVGDPGVGKTSIIRRFTENKFTDAYRATIGLNIL